MIVTIHQPIHFPYMGFFQKMELADIFVLLDDVQFSKNEFYNRNKFKNSSGIDEWFTVPVEKKANGKLIKDVMIAEDYGWRRKLAKQMKQNFGDSFLEIYEGNKLVDVNIRSIEYSKEKLNIGTKMIRSSELMVTGYKSERLYNICKKLGAEKYISGPFGKHYLDKKLFKGIDVEIFEPKVDDYYTVLTHFDDIGDR
jgi:hypothetical protein